MKRRRHPMPLPILTMGLLLGNLGAFAYELANGGETLCQAHGFVPAHPTVDTALTSLFLHDPNDVAHIAGNMACLAIFGTRVEPVMGLGRFALLYLLGGLGGAAMHAVVDPTSVASLVGASGAIFAVLSADAMIYRRSVGFFATLAAFNITLLVTGSAGSLAAGAHIGGYATGFVFMLATWLVRGGRLDPRSGRFA